MADDQFALLHLLLGRRGSAVRARPRVAGQSSRQPFLGEGVAIVLGDVIHQIKLGVDGGMAVIDRVRILRIEVDGVAINVGDRLRNQEWGDGAYRAVGFYDGLDKARGIAGWLGEQSPSPRVGAKVEVKRPVLLEENEHVFDVLLKQSLFLSVGKDG